MDKVETSPRLSVIIPCLNEAEYVPKLLQDLVDQDIDEPFEVIVADSSSEDGTLEAAGEFTDELNLKLTNTDRMSAGHTRNAGAEIASGEYLLFLDADGRIKKHFLRILMQERDEHNADMMTTHYTASGWMPFDKNYYKSGSKYFFQASFENGDPRMSGCVQFVDSKLHAKVSGFRDELTVGEDMDYSKRISKHAKKPHFISDLTYTASNRRFKTDGRITMLLRSAKWLGGGERFDIDSADSFEFGHYSTGNKKIRLRDLIMEPRLGWLVLVAVWLHIKAGFSAL